jgi:dephospho-CoA kinase
VYLVGLTGGIGSGKSTVAERCRGRGWPVIDADGAAREIVAPGEPALAELAERFGGGVLAADGSLDRAALARIAFVDDRSRAALDAITHPRIAERIADQLARLAGQDPPVRIAVLDHPLLIETEQVDRVDAVLVVLADAERRVERLVSQRGIEEQDARARLRAQTDDATRRAVATYVVANDGDLDDLAVATDAVLDRIEQDARAAGRRDREDAAW